MTSMLEIDDLRIELIVEGRLRPVIHGLSMDIAPGEAVGLVGESGSGKSMTARSVIRLLPAGAAVTGSVRFDGADVARMDDRTLRRYRAEKVGMVFQDPRAHINPVRSVGDFLTEGLTKVRGVGKGEAFARAERMLAEVGVPDPARRLDQHPYELSGGLLQRTMIASVLLAEPSLILADEPTTALDVTTQEEVMAILDGERRERGLALLFITHDLELAAAVCDRIVVMYAGGIVEERPAATLHEGARHPYTSALLAARPEAAAPGQMLRTVPGHPQSAFEAPPGCAFAPRCPFVQASCHAERPVLRPLDGGAVACAFAEQIRDGAIEARGVQHA